LQRFANDPLLFEPETQYRYSTYGWVLVRAAVEAVANEPFFTFMRTQVFAPLGMVDTTFALPDAKADRMTDAWRLDEQGERQVADLGARSGWRRQGRFLSGGGGLVSGVADYHRFARMLLRGGELDGVRLLRADTVAQMRSNQLPGGGDLASLSSAMFSEADYQDVGFGLGFAMGLERGEYYWGGVFSTYFWVDPVERLIGIFMTQLLPSSAYPVRAQLRAGVAEALVRRG